MPRTRFNSRDLQSPWLIDNRHHGMKSFFYDDDDQQDDDDDDDDQHHDHRQHIPVVFVVGRRWRMAAGRKDQRARGLTVMMINDHGDHKHDHDVDICRYYISYVYMKRKKIT